MMPGLLLKTVTVCASIVFALAFLEGVCRFQAWYAPEPQGYPTAMQNVWLGRYWNRNSLGFRDVEPRPTTLPRLVVVGDSYAFGWGINQIEDRYGEQLGRLLGWQSINAGVPDTDTPQHLEFVAKILPLNPKVIILLYCFNDIKYIRPVRTQPTVPLRPLFDHSHLVQQLILRVRSFVDTPPLPDPYRDEAILDRHIADVRKFADRAARNGAIVAVVPFIRMWGDEGQYDRFVAAARSEHIPVWPIKDAFRGYELKELMINGFDTHPNEKAHAIAAEATLPYVVERTHVGAAPALAH